MLDGPLTSCQPQAPALPGQVPWELQINYQAGLLPVETDPRPVDIYLSRWSWSCLTPRYPAMG